MPIENMSEKWYNINRTKLIVPERAVCCAPAFEGTIRKNSHYVSSAIHIKIGKQIKRRQYDD